MTVPGFLRWRSWGAAERRALLLHDAGSSSSTWWRAGAALAAAGWRVKAPDLPSHGASPRVSAPLTPGTAAARLIDDLADRPIDLVVGHGFGAAVALALQQRGPAIHSVVLEEYDGGGRDWPAAAEAMMAAADRARRDPEAARAELQLNRPTWAEQDCRQAVHDLAVCAVEEVADALRNAHAWPRLLVDSGVPTLSLDAHTSHRSNLDGWLAAVHAHGAEAASERTVIRGDRVRPW